MISRFAIFMETEDGSVFRIFSSEDFDDEQAAETYLTENIGVFGNDKTYLILKIRVSQ
jgi:hypothetical protein